MTLHCREWRASKLIEANQGVSWKKSWTSRPTRAAASLLRPADRLFRRLRQHARQRVPHLSEAQRVGLLIRGLAELVAVRDRPARLPSRVRVGARQLLRNELRRHANLRELTARAAKLALHHDELAEGRVEVVLGCRGQDQWRRRRRAVGGGRPDLGETGPLSRGVQAGRKALRIRYINGMEVRKKRPRGFKKEAQGVQVSPLNPLSVAPWRQPPRCPGSAPSGVEGPPERPARWPGAACSTAA